MVGNFESFVNHSIAYLQQKQPYPTDKSDWPVRMYYDISVCEYILCMYICLFVCLLVLIRSKLSVGCGKKSCFDYSWSKSEDNGKWVSLQSQTFLLCNQFIPRMCCSHKHCFHPEVQKGWAVPLFNPYFFDQLCQLRMT